MRTTTRIGLCLAGALLLALLACIGSAPTAPPPPITQVIAMTQIVPVTQIISITQIVPVTQASPDYALQLDGADDCIELGTWFDFKEFTLSLWVKPRQQVNDFANILDDNHTAYRAWVAQQNEHQNNYYMWGSSGEGTQTPIYFSLTADVWQHIVIVRDAAESRVYVDGQQVSAVSDLPPVPYDGTQFFRLGCWGGGGRYWVGAMDELQVWSRALSAFEVVDLTHPPLSGTEEGLEAYYSFNAGAGTVLADMGPKGRDGRLRGQPQWVLAGHSP